MTTAITPERVTRWGGLDAAHAAIADQVERYALAAGWDARAAHRLAYAATHNGGGANNPATANLLRLRHATGAFIAGVAAICAGAGYSRAT